MSNCSREFAYITENGIPRLLEKVVQKMENHLRSARHNEVENSCSALSEILYKIGLYYLNHFNDKSLDNLKSILNVIHLVGNSISLPQSSLSKEFFSSIYERVKNNLYSLPVEHLEVLFVNYPLAIENEVLGIMSVICRTEYPKDSNEIKKAVQTNSIIPACCKHASTFQKSLFLLSDAWQYSGANLAVQFVMQEFFSAVKTRCKNPEDIVSLFPENMQPPVMLLSIPLYSGHSSHLWSCILNALELGLCSRKEVNVLMCIHPSWYQQLITDTKKQANEESLQLLCLLWHCDSTDVLSKCSNYS